MREDVVFDGIRLSDYFEVASAVVSNLNVSTQTQDVSGMDGTVVTGSKVASREITVYLVLEDGDVSERKEQLRELFGMLDTTEEHPLYVESDNGRYYMAKLDGEQAVIDKPHIGRVALRFLAPSPYLHGERQSVTVPSGGSVTFKVGGTRITYPRVQGTATRDATTGMWGLRLDNADVMRVPMAVSQATVDIDCNAMTVKVNGSSAMIDPTSYWFELSAGTHTIQNFLGTGSCTVEWETIWL